MPNAPAMVGQGMAALVRAPGATRADEAHFLPEGHLPIIITREHVVL